MGGVGLRVGRCRAPVGEEGEVVMALEVAEQECAVGVEGDGVVDVGEVEGGPGEGDGDGRGG